MKRGGGKGKGNQWERDFCRDLSNWWTEGKDPDAFWRADMEKKGLEARMKCGDVVATSDAGKELTRTCGIELKAYKDIELITNLIRPGAKSKVNDWWEKIEMETKPLVKEPILVVKIDRRETFVFIRDGFLFTALCHRLRSFNSCGIFEYTGKYEYKLLICLWEDFKEQYMKTYRNGYH